MDKEHAMIRPFHGHMIEKGKKGGTSNLFMTIGTCRVTPADEDPVHECVIMVAEYRHEPVFMRKGVDHLQGFPWPISAVDEIAEIDKDIDRPELLTELRGPDT